MAGKLKFIQGTCRGRELTSVKQSAYGGENADSAVGLIYTFV